MVGMRKNRLSQHNQGRLLEHFGAGTTARCAAGKSTRIWPLCLCG